MTRTPLFILLPAFGVLCRAAPLHDVRRALNSSASAVAFSSSMSSATVSSSGESPSTTQQGATSSPTLTMVTNWAAFPNGTIGFAVNQLLSSIGSDAVQRFVLAEIGTTQIGGSNLQGSNKDLHSTVDAAFGEGPGSTWVDTYTDFLLAAGGNATAPINFTQWFNAREVVAEQQVKLVKAYGETHSANITYVGIDVPGLQRIPTTTLWEIQNWGSEQNCTSSVGNATQSCPYSVEDDLAYDDANTVYSQLQTQMENLTVMQNMSFMGYEFQNTFQGDFPGTIFNFSMDVGGESVPAWTATVLGLANTTKTLESDLQKASNASSTGTDGLLDPLGMVGRNSAAGTDTPPEGSGALQFIAHNTNSPQPHTGTNSAIAAAAVSSNTTAVTGDANPTLSGPLLTNQHLVLLALQEGSWVDGRDATIEFVRQNSPGIFKKYFGGSSGSGPIGRRWSHLVLSMAVDESSQVSADLLGKVYEVLPVLSTPY
ncbi:hypothetical protein DFH07DRAFT_261018 [Mycena maculata]|uniref:Uncharacterized protein n=1 Tax=Mycena maculata TaxID=230809 RepID=A0AAD7MN33_9AGAR|nr:hypothetical protein DFH07DRAFT_261018 [Mycena maculata]